MSEEGRCTLHESKTNAEDTSCSYDDKHVVQNGDICLVVSENNITNAFICNDGFWNTVKGTDTGEYCLLSV